jgi:hypothetical protein
MVQLIGLRPLFDLPVDVCNTPHELLLLLLLLWFAKLMKLIGYTFAKLKYMYIYIYNPWNIYFYQLKISSLVFLKK